MSDTTPLAKRKGREPVPQPKKETANMKHSNIKEVIHYAKTRAGKRPTTSKVINFQLKGWGTGGGQVYLRGKTILHIWTYNGFSGSYDAKWNSETKQWAYDGWSGNDEASKANFMAAVAQAAQNK